MTTKIPPLSETPDTKKSEKKATKEQSETKDQSTAPKPEVPKSKDRTEGAASKRETTQNAPWTDQRWQTVFTGLILLVTAIYSSVSYFQWETMKQTLEFSEKALQTSEKARFRVNDIQADFKAAEIRIEIENIGHATADRLDVRIDLVRTIKDQPDASALEGNSYEFANIIADTAPGGIKTVIAVPLQNFTSHDADLIKTGMQILHIACSLDYRDGFENHVRTGLFEFTYTPPPHEGWAQMQLLKYVDNSRRRDGNVGRDKNQENPD